MRLVCATVSVLVAVVLLAGCSEDDPVPAPPVAPSSGTPTASESVTVEPDVSLTVAPKGETAKQFIRRWVALGDEMQRTGETEGFRAVAGPDCLSCEKLADRVAKIYGAGGEIVTDGSSVVRIEHDGGGQWSVRLMGGKTTYRESAAADPESLDGGPYELVMYIANVGGTWVLGDYQDKS